MIPINTTYAPVQALVDELARCGMTHAVTCPGSRNAPLALVLAAHPDIEAISVVDERSAGFVALGIAKHSGRPVAVTTTSGTAAANLMPAVVEAHESALPLIVLTADRPPELREVGAGQAIDQVKLYGSFAKLFVEVGNHDPGRASAIHHRQLGCRAYATALYGRPGPVHLNFPLREPLAPLPGELSAEDWDGRENGRPWTDPTPPYVAPQPDPENELTALLTSSRRGLVVCGGGDRELAAAGLELGARLRWPVLADPISGVRCNGLGYDDQDPVIAHYDLLLRSESFAAERPDVVVRIGEMPTSKPLRAWLEGCRQIVIDPYMDWHDPTRRAESIWQIGARDLFGLLPEASGGDPRWLNRWRKADAIVPEVLAEAEEPFEPLAYNAVAETAALLWVSSSLPIRDVESYLPHSPAHLPVFANRGANGIDGVVSSAAGAALSTDYPVHLIIGELALLHDIGGLVTARRAGAELAILCVNNGGGAIFDFLPVAEAADRAAYEEHIATPVEFDLSTAAKLGELEHHVATTADEVRERLEPGSLVELRVDRAESLRRHREVAARIVARLDAL